MKKINLFIKHDSIKIYGDYDFETKKILVYKGTQLSRSPSKSFNKSNYFKFYLQFREETLISNENILLKDYEFSSVSLAASLIKGNSTNGMIYWMVDDDTSLKDYIDRDVTLDPQKVQEGYVHDFLKDIDILEKLNDEDSFNIFSTLKIVKNEIRHSNVLAWLLDPYESHGLKDFFAKQFVREIYLENSIFLKKLDIGSLFLWDFDQVEIYREKDNIDILFVDVKNHFILAIENKIFSKEHNNQLSRYKESTLKRYSNSIYKHFFVYLNVEDEEASDDDWITVSYELVLRVLLKSLPLLKDKGRAFIEDYINIIRRNIMEDEKLAKLCKDIYLKHREALDLIYQFKPDHTLELTEYIKEKITENVDISLNQSRKSLIRFASTNLTNFNNKHRDVGHGWVKDNSIILYEIKIQSKKIVIVLVVGPTKDDTRNQIIDKFSKSSEHKPNRTNKWTTIDKADITNINNIEDLENIKSDIDKKLINKIKEFIQKNDLLINKL